MNNNTKTTPTICGLWGFMLLGLLFLSACVSDNSKFVGTWGAYKYNELPENSLSPDHLSHYFVFKEGGTGYFIVNRRTKRWNMTYEYNDSILNILYYENDEQKCKLFRVLKLSEDEIILYGGYYAILVKDKAKAFPIVTP